MAHLYDDAPLETEEIVFLDEFGAQAVYGGLMTVVDMRRVLWTKRLMTAYKTRERAENMAEWAEKHEAENGWLTWAERIYNDGA